MRNQVVSYPDAPESLPGLHRSSVAKAASLSRSTKLRQLTSRFCATTLVFEDDGQVSAPDPNPVVGEWIAADHDNINVLFANFAIHRRVFSRFLDENFLGLILVHNGEWVSYGWSSQPREKHPPHVPPWVSHLSAYWIFYCHTREEFRGRGLYKQLLARMVHKAHLRQPKPTVYVDALPANVASRRSILSAGFNPAGVLTTYKFWLPRVAHIAVAGSWHRNEHHPPL